MSLGRPILLASALLGFGAFFPQACGRQSVVGGGCRDGLSNCSNQCVDLRSDPDNCGECGHVCNDGVVCTRGVCEGEDSGGASGDAGSSGSGDHERDSGVDADSSVTGHGGNFTEYDVGYPEGGDAGQGAGGSSGSGTSTQGGTGQTEGGSSGASTTAGRGGTSSAGSSGEAGTAGTDTCVPPYNTATDCGECGRRCSNSTPVCAPVGGDYDCVPLCEEPLVDCSGSCVDLNNDSKNCGDCGRVCPSAICQGAECIGAAAGHIIAICMNYRQTAADSQPTTLLGNAVLLPLTDNVRILAYDGYAEPTVRAHVDSTIAWAGAARGRTFTIDSVSVAEEVNSLLRKPDYDVFLVYDQPNAPAGELSTIGSQWATALESFSLVGGVVVVLSGNDGRGEMGALLTSARLLTVTDEATVSQQQVVNRAPADAVGINVVSPFLAWRDSCVFETPVPSDGTTVFVVTEDVDDLSSARPLAVHRIAIPPSTP